MKKSIVIISFCLVIISAVILSISFIKTSSDSYKVTTIKTSYNITSTIKEKDEIVIPIYSNNKKCDLVDIKKVANCYICDSSEENSFLLTLNRIEEGENTLQINQEEFYEYNYYFSINNNINSEYNLSIEKAYLKIILKEKEIKMFIGSLSYYKILSYGDEYKSLDLVSLKAIVNELDEEKSIVGVVIGLRNNSTTPITVNNINLLDINLKAATNEIKIINELPDSTDNISELLGYTYNPKEFIDSSELKIEIKATDTIYLLVPIKKIGEIYTNRFGLQINYLYSNTQRTYYLDDFLYFKSNRNLKYEDFEIITYENN